jgi:hypothetical protein
VGVCTVGIIRVSHAAQADWVVATKSEAQGSRSFEISNSSDGGVPVASAWVVKELAEVLDGVGDVWSGPEC